MWIFYKNRVKLVAKQVPVKIVDCTVKPGDIVCADDSGVFVIPAERLGETVETALRIEEMRDISSKI
jgi:regulator of RNase E activity RraA